MSNTTPTIFGMPMTIASDGRTLVVSALFTLAVVEPANGTTGWTGRGWISHSFLGSPQITVRGASREETAEKLDRALRDFLFYDQPRHEALGVEPCAAARYH